MDNIPDIRNRPARIDTSDQSFLGREYIRCTQSHRPTRRRVEPMRIVNILVVRSERVIGRKVKLTRMRPYNSKLTSETSPNKTNPSKSHLAAAAATPSPSALYYPSSTSYGRAHCAPTNKQYHPMAPVQQHPPAPYSSSSPAVSLPPEDPAPGSRTDAAGRLRTGGTSTPGSPRLSTHGRRDSAKVAELHAYRHVSRET